MQTRPFQCFVLLGAAILGLLRTNTSTANSSNQLGDTIRSSQQKVVKIYGAGGFQQLEAYQTGVLVSADGEILTVLSYVLDTDELVVVLDDGRKFTPELVATETLRELALLKIDLEGEPLPYFDLGDLQNAEVGDRVLALSNLYGIASGNEPVSVLQGVVTAIAPLDARRGSFFTANREPVYIVDAYANNPGAAGGALVDWNGQFLGLLGKELRSRTTGAWLNYALRAEGVHNSLTMMREGKTNTNVSDPLRPGESVTLEELGLRLVPEVLPTTPPFVDGVRSGSPAEKAGIQLDDLIVFLDGRQVASCRDLTEMLKEFSPLDPLSLGILRKGELVNVNLQDTEEELP